MCTLVLSMDPNHGSLLLAANRDEAYARPSETPRILDESVALFGGRDGVAGGTWLAIRLAAPRRVVAVLNRREHTAPPAEAPANRLSRGLLCLEAGRAAELASIPSLLRDRLATFPVAPFTLLAAEPGFVAAFAFEGGELRLAPVDPGVHAWTHDDADDPDDARVQHVLAAARDASPRWTGVGAAPPASPAPLDAFASAVLPALASHAGERPVCLHGERYGTVSAALVALSSHGPPEFRFAAGPPCTTPPLPLALPALGPAAGG